VTGIEAGAPARRTPRARRPVREWAAWARALVMALALLVYAFPVILVLTNSLKTKSDIITDPLGLPSAPTFDNYAQAFERMDYLTAFRNTLVITISSVVVICLFGAMAAYFISRVPWRGNRVIFYAMVLSMLVPFQVLMIPMVKLLGTLGLLSHSWSVVYIYFASGVPLAVFMYSGFIRSIPKDLDEAAMLDGAGRIRTFFSVILPLLRPMTLTLVILNVLFFWNDFLMPFLILQRPEQRTLTLATLTFVQSHTAEYGLMMAALVMTVLPIFVAYAFMQRHIIEGMVRGAVK
jgi:raffinose/stachyose/melibiose transport system permease protein